MKNIYVLKEALKNEFGDKVTVNRISPLHDEDFEPSYMICVDGVITCRADLSLKDICEAVEKMINK